MNYNMHTVQNVSKRIELLLISLEALNLNNCLYQSHNTLWTNIIVLKQNNKKTINLNKHYQNIILIRFLHTLIQQLPLGKKVVHLLKDYNKHSSSITLLQYLKRYQYLYQKTQPYYLNKSQDSMIDIKEKAIINLYIIYNIYKTQKLYFLIEYFYSY